MSATHGPAPPRWLALAPWIFVFIWASGYVVAKVAAPYAEPLSFLVLRYCGTVVLMGVLALAMRAAWPTDRRAVMHIALAGVLMQACYLGGVWVAIRQGLPAGVAALIVNLQPVLTAVAGPMIGERVTGRQWVGLVLGFAGVAIVVSSKTGGAAAASAVALCVFALLAMTAGTLYQKRFCPVFDLRTGQVIQFVASVAVTLPFVFAFESFQITWNVPVVASLLWSVLVLTAGGISLLYTIIRHGAATEVTSMLYLVPGITAVMAWLMFGESFAPIAIVGMVVTIAGVALVVKKASTAR